MFPHLPEVLPGLAVAFVEKALFTRVK